MLEGAQAAYLANGMYDANGRFLGHVVYRLSFDGMRALIEPDSPDVSQVLYRTDGTIVAASSNAVDPAIGGIEGQSGHLQAVLNSSSSEIEVNGQHLFFGYSEVDALGVDWILMAEKDHAAQLVAADELLQTTIPFVLAALGLTAILGVFLARSVSKPLVGVRHAIRDIADGKSGTAIPGLSRGDEIGDIAASLKSLSEDIEAASAIEAENRFKSEALNSSSAALMIVDADLVITFLNPQAIDLMEKNDADFANLVPDFEVGTLIGSRMSRFQNAFPEIVNQMENATSDQMRGEVELGEKRLVLLVASVVNEEGVNIGFVAEWQDVTEERKQSAIFQAIEARNCMFEVSTKGHVLNCNENMAKALGLSTGRADTQTFLSLWHPSKRGQATEIWATLMSGQPFDGKIEISNASGQSVWLQAAISLVLNSKGEPQKFVCVASDVSESEVSLQKSAQAQSQMSEAQSKVVKELSAGLERLSNGDLASGIETQFDPEYEQLRKDFNGAVEQLNAAMAGVTENADAIRGEAHQISTAADDLSKRTEHQAGTLEETAAALDELTASVRSAAEGAERANAVVVDARGNAIESGEVVKQAVSAMGQIEQSSQQISKIIGVIDDIAFQTNLLALNAGVEAARAGDAGRGFAVVASEVRALAQRSSEAAKEIGTLISSSGSHVKRGVGLVDEAGKALEQIVGSIANIADHVSEIAVSAQQQSSGLAEINTAVNQLDHVTQQNAAMFEETTAASHSLTREAQNLTDMISRFQIKGSGSYSDSPNASHRLQSEIVEVLPKRAQAASATSSAAHLVSEENDWNDF